jgi:hypothetical protein
MKNGGLGLHVYFPATFPSFFPAVSQPISQTAGKENDMQKLQRTSSLDPSLDPGLDPSLDPSLFPSLDPNRNPIPAHPLLGNYKAQLQHINCDLELGLDQSGCLTGSFFADGENLEITGGVPSVFGEVYGVIRERSNLETVAVFRAVPHIRQLVLEVDVPNAHNVMELGNAERIIFERFEIER